MKLEQVHPNFRWSPLRGKVVTERPPQGLLCRAELPRSAVRVRQAAGEELSGVSRLTSSPKAIQSVTEDGSLMSFTACERLCSMSRTEESR